MVPLSGKDKIEEIRLHNDIAEVIGRYVVLKKNGARFVALCPFHKEKTPSFHVDPSKQMFHCFGCNAGGDVFSFIMRQESLTFPEAARMLAERVGISFETSAEDRPKDGLGKNALLEAHQQLADFYADMLAKNATAQNARAYLAERDLDGAIKDFQLGFAPPDTRLVMDWAQQKKISMPLLEKIGVLLPNDRGGPMPYDRFRGRLMFPIRDEQGRVIGFSGRILDKSSPAKYVNSPETPLFHKGRMLYGLDRARQAMVESRRAVVCEGQIDVVRCHLAGLREAVAPQGTALTEAHAILLKRYADEVVLVFDADTAGQNATLRAAEVLLQAGLNLRVASLPPGEDPDSWIRKNGADSFQQRIHESATLVGYQVALLSERENLSDPTSLLRATRSVLESIQHAPSAVQREQYIREASALLSISEDALWHDLRAMIRPVRAEARKPLSTPATQAPHHPPLQMAVIELLMAHPEVTDMVLRYLPHDTITDADCRTLLQAIIEHPDPHDGHIMDRLTTASEECRRLAAQISINARTIRSEEISPEIAAQDLILSLRIQQMEQQRKTCQEKLKTAGAEEQRHLRNESAQLTVLKKKLSTGWAAALPFLEFDPDE